MMLSKLKHHFKTCINWLVCNDCMIFVFWFKLGSYMKIKLNNFNKLDVIFSKIAICLIGNLVDQIERLWRKWTFVCWLRADKNINRSRPNLIWFSMNYSISIQIILSKQIISTTAHELNNASKLKSAFKIYLKITSSFFLFQLKTVASQFYLRFNWGYFSFTA